MVWTKEEEESRKICEIELAPKYRELETDRIMGGIGYVFVEREMTEQPFASINIRDVKVKAMESKTRDYIIKPMEVSRKFKIGINKAKDKLLVTIWKGVRHVVHTSHHRYIVDNTKLNRKCLDAQFYTNHLLAKLIIWKGTQEPQFTVLEFSL